MKLLIVMLSGFLFAATAAYAQSPRDDLVSNIRNLTSLVENRRAVICANALMENTCRREFKQVLDEIGSLEEMALEARESDRRREFDRSRLLRKSINEQLRGIDLEQWLKRMHIRYRSPQALRDHVPYGVAFFIRR